LNAANEIAVGAFLAGSIGYTQIAELIALALELVPARALESIETCVDVDAETRRVVQGRLPGGAAATAAAMPGRITW
jgi:1-deoxy-D-xylulose-5-phosphate reductoisomerase